MVKYPESNQMHKKMLQVSKKIWNLQAACPVPVEHIKDELWQGQCNCPYWHGVFGGLYLNYLRHAIYEHLIKAEDMADRIQHQDKKWLDVEVTDHDCDGNDEVIVSSELMNIYIDPDCGGSVFELDYRPKAFNLVNTLSRKEEVYHENVRRSDSHQLTLTGTANGAASIHDVIRVKEIGLHKHLNYDWYRRLCFIDHFFQDGTTIEEFSSCSYRELGDFVNQPYSHREVFKKDEVSVILGRDGSIGTNGNRKPLRVTKTFTVTAGSAEMDVKWQVQNTGDSDVSVRMGVEFNFGLLSGHSDDRYYVIDGQKPVESHLASTGISKDIYEVDLIDKWSGMGIILDSSRRADLWRFPIETVSQSEGGFEKTYQNSCLLASWKLNLKPGAVHEHSVKFRIKEGAF